MSTSISFAISSADQDLGPTSKSFVDLRKSQPDCYLSPNRAVDGGHHKNEHYERRHTGVGSTGAEPDFFESGTSKLKRWRHHTTHRDSLSDSRSISREDEASLGEDFYEEVDERMSRNSLEYPEHQARYIDRWLKSAQPAAMRTRSFEDDHDDDHHHHKHNKSCDHIKGNVIGIRGFSSENSISSIRYNNLKGEYLKLQSSHNKLRRRFDEASHQYEQIFKKKDQHLEALRVVLTRQCRRLHDRDRDGSHQQSPERTRSGRGSLEIEVDRLRHELRRLEARHEQCEKDKQEVVDGLACSNDKLRHQLATSKTELAELEVQVKNLSLEPKNRKLLALYNENVRLKGSLESGQVEFRALEDNYAKLEQRLQSMCREQECHDKERGAEMNRLFIELCRLQVYQPKLEALLDTERKIKQELQARLDASCKENTELRDKLDSSSQELNLERTRSRGLESIEMETVRGELAHLRDRYERLDREKQASGELLRVAQSKVALLEGRHRDELDSLTDGHRHEVDRLQRDLNRLTIERDSLQLKVAGLEERLADAERAVRVAVEEQVADMQKRLQLNANDNASNRDLTDRLELTERRLRSADDKLTSLARQLETSETKRRELHDELADKRNQLEQCRQQVQDLRRRLDLQTASFGQLREQKDKELARLRVDLNFEQYNRQVALKGLERELRGSLKELETMKCRFSRRLTFESDSRNSSSINKSSLAAAADAASGSNHVQPNSSSNSSNQTVKLQQQQQQQQPQDSQSTRQQQQQQQQQLNSVTAKLIASGPAPSRA